MYSGNHIKFDIIEDRVGVLTLCNPKKLNTMSQTYFDEMAELQPKVTKKIADGDIRAIAVVAEGKHFSAGIDLNFLNVANPKWAFKNLHNEQMLNEFWERCNVPVVCGVQGVCIGAGFELALWCDVRIGTEKSRFSMPEVKYGLAPDIGGCVRLTKLLGPSRAKYIILTCDEIVGREALEYGIVEKIVPVEELYDTTIATARKMAKLPPLSVQIAKKCVNAAKESSQAAALLAEEIQCILCLDTPDMKEAISAFMEKREPTFKGLD
jgi:enoyl-CoA hydratase